MSAERNKARVLDLIERVMNGHDLGALNEFTSIPRWWLPRRVCCVRSPISKPTCDGLSPMVTSAVFVDIGGTQQGPWLFVQEPTNRRVETSYLLAFRFDDDVLFDLPPRYRKYYDFRHWRGGSLSRNGRTDEQPIL